jgi:hypothetical protein
MRLEIVTYSGRIVAEECERFPEYVNKAMLIKHGYLGSHVTVDAEHHEAVLYLDNLFSEHIADGRCQRFYHVEIDRKEIPNYTHFRIFPYELWHGTMLFCSVKRPTCDVDGCVEGAKLVSKIIVRKKRTSKLDIGLLQYTFNKEVVLFLSARLKRIMEAEGVTGLKYEQAEYVIKPRRRLFTKEGITHWICKETGKLEEDPAPEAENPWIARITHSVYRKSDVIPHLVCYEHSTMEPWEYFMCQLPRQPMPVEDTQDMDFFQVRGWRVGEAYYEYRYNSFFVTRKVVELLLKHKVKGLCGIGTYLNTKIAPMWE